MEIIYNILWTLFAVIWVCSLPLACVGLCFRLFVMDSVIFVTENKYRIKEFNSNYDCVFGQGKRWSNIFLNHEFYNQPRSLSF